MGGLTLVVIVVASAAISAGGIRALLPWLQRHAMAHPNARSSHRIPTPQGGGIAVVGAAVTVAAAGVVAALVPLPADIGTLWWALGAAVFIALVGAADDARSVGVAPRLMFQAAAVCLVVASLPVELRVVPILPWWVERAILLVGCLWFVNLTNFMDGIDWMTVAEFVPLAAGLVVIGMTGALPDYAIFVALALAGGLIGFAPFNRPVARIFLGDVGSLPIGLLFGWLLVLLASRGYVIAALVLPLYYLADSTLTLLWRAARREPFWQAHRTHFYQVATDRGFSVGEIVARVFLVNVILLLLATASVLWPSPSVDFLALGGGAIAVGGLLWHMTKGKP